MAKNEDSWGERRPNTRRIRKPYNDDYKEDSRRSRERRRSAERREEDVRIVEDIRDLRRPVMEDRQGREEQGPGREAGRKRRKRKKGTGWLILLILILLLAGLFLAGTAVLGSLWSRVDSADFGKTDIGVNPDLPASVGKYTRDYRTIMVFGVDSRDNSTLRAGALSDSNIVLAIHRRTGDVKLLSLYRDTYVETTTGEHMKLTEVYNKYGAKEQINTINKNFDMNVSDYITLNWKAVADTINKLGGIDLDLSSEECRGINSYIDEVMASTGVSSDHMSVEDGVQHVDGIQAVTYCRLRKGLGDDYRRTERQRTVITKTLAKAKSAGITRVLAVCGEIFPGISTSLSLMDVLSLASGMGRYDIKDSDGFPFESESEDGGRYFVFPVTLASNTAQLHEYLYGNTEYVPSETVDNLSRMISEYSGFY